jgi:hypothetical protein
MKVQGTVVKRMVYDEALGRNISRFVAVALGYSASGNSKSEAILNLKKILKSLRNKSSSKK